MNLKFLDSILNMTINTNIPIWSLVIFLIIEFVAFYGGYVMLKKTVEILKTELDKVVSATVDVPTMKLDILNLKNEMKINNDKDKDSDVKREDLRKELYVAIDRQSDKIHAKITTQEHRVGEMAQGLIKLEAKMEMQELLRQKNKSNNR